MVLRPLEPTPADQEDFVPAWEAVMRTQKQYYESCWLMRRWQPNWQHRSRRRSFPK